MYLLKSMDQSIDNCYILSLVLHFGVGAPMFLFCMGASVRDFHLPLPIDSQGFCMYVAYYLMILVLLFGVHASVLIFGMDAPMLP